MAMGDGYRRRPMAYLYRKNRMGVRIEEKANGRSIQEKPYGPTFTGRNLFDGRSLQERTWYGRIYTGKNLVWTE
jgi:hypothetical protein